ncbi:MAG: 4'-phosphopantetheinyl transferase superfamily protein [Kiritimatiellia bacterium]
MDCRQDIPVQDWARPGEPFRLAAVAVGAVDWGEVLPAESRDRAARFAEGPARARAGASEWLKVRWLPRELGLERVEMEIGANGKPQPGGAAAEWGFNLSHAGEYAVAVLARGAAVGVDLEATNRRVEAVRLAERVFSESEQAHVRAGGRGAFFALWSQKEALMKALGCGWADGAIQRRTRLETAPFQAEPATGARIWSRFVLDGAYALAVAVLGGIFPSGEDADVALGNRHLV